MNSAGFGGSDSHGERGIPINSGEESGRRRIRLKASVPPLDLSVIDNPAVRSAIGAMNRKDKKRWFEQFFDKPAFTDDGIPRDFARWCEQELFGSSLAYLVAIDKVEDKGLTLYGRYHSDKWGDFKTFWRFVVENGRISKLDVGATDY